MSAKIAITDHDSGEQIGQKEIPQSQPQIIKPTPIPTEPDSQPSFVHPIPKSEPPLEEMAVDVPTPEVPRFGTLQPKVDAHPLFSGAKEPKPKNRRWLKRTLAPVLALLVVLIILYLAMDAGLVKGYSHLPFHFFKAPVVATAPTITPAKTAVTTTPTTTDPYAGWKTYTLKYEKLTFKYPSDWVFNDSSTTAGDNVTLTSGSGLVLTLLIGAHPPVDHSANNTISSETIKFAGKPALLSLWTGENSDKTQVATVMLTDTNGKQFNALNSPKDTQAGNSLVDIQVGFGKNVDQSPKTVPISSLSSSADYSDAKLIIASMSY